MKNQLFRQKSLDKISSPERTDDYIKSVGKNLWLAALACLIVLCGFLLWGIFGKVEITVKTASVCKDGETVCFISEKDMGAVSGDTQFRINGKSYGARVFSDKPGKVSETVPEFAAHVAGFDGDDWVYAAVLDAEFPDGVYETDIVTMSVPPILLLTD